MKKLLAILLLLLSMTSFAGRIKVQLDKITDQVISVDNLIKISSMNVKLVCHWNTTFYQDLGDEDNSFSTRAISVEINESNGVYSISTDEELNLNKHRFSKNKYCLARFDMTIESELMVAENSYMVSTKLGTRGNITEELLKVLNSKTFMAEVFINILDERGLSRVLLK